MPGSLKLNLLAEGLTTLFKRASPQRLLRIGQTLGIKIKFEKAIDKLLRMCYFKDRGVITMWSVKEAAHELGISEQRVRKLLSEGRIKAKKLGRDWVVLKLAYTKKRGVKK